MRGMVLLTSLLLCSATKADSKPTDSQAAVVPLAQAHAHNDYLHSRPLLDALSHGFCSVEADIFLADNELQIGHFRNQLKKGRTLQKLYLDPLRQRIKTNGGTVYKNSKTPFTLLIDLKTGDPTYAALHKALSEYDDILSRVEDGKSQPGAVSVVISGNRPMRLVAQSNPRFCGIDGRLSDLKTDKPAHLMPLISDNWRSHFKWRGDGPMPTSERTKLHDAVKQAHAAGRRVRFWATPENEAIWKELHAAKVDMLNTDQLERLQKFLSK